MAGTIPTPPVPPADFVNGPLYKAARFSTEYAAVPPNFHRLYNAIGLAGGLFLGRKLMDMLVGETPDGKKIDREDIPGVLQPLHGVLHYDHFSDNPHDRWMKVFDRLVPAAVGAMGACAGSAKFFDKAFIKPAEHTLSVSKSDPAAFTLFDAERQALYHQSKPWSLLTGTSALFGSASGLGLFPSIAHYGADLGTLFAIRSERSTAPLGKLVNSHTHLPYRPTKLLKFMVDHASGNPSENPEQMNDYANGVLKTWFRGVTKEQVNAFTDVINSERTKFVEMGKSPAEVETALQASLKNLITGAGLEKTLMKIGLDPREASIGDQGFVSILGHISGDIMGLGTSKKVEETWKQAVKGMEMRNPSLAGKAFDQQAHQYVHNTAQKVTAATAIGVAGASLGLIGTAKDADVGDVAKSITPAENMNAVNKKFSESVGGHRHILHSKKNHGFVNSRLLDASEGVTDTFNVVNGVNSHRLYCAVGLTAGSWMGEEFMKAVTGLSFHGTKVKKEDVLQPFQKLYKIMPFNSHSDLPNDKWMQVLRWAVPMALGCASIVAASNMYFHERQKKLKNATYLDEVEEKATSVQANQWTASTAISALFGASSGFAWIPGINYMTHLGTRYSMASGRKVSMPLVGKQWSDNSTLFPFAPPGMVDLIIKEAVNNKSYNPELLETYAIGVLKPWFDKVTPDQIEAFVTQVYDIRDKFYKEGGVPEDMKQQLEDQLKDHLKGAGLEETLREVGLDPLKAKIADNGYSGKIAESMGAKRTIEKIKSDYTASYLERIQKRQLDQGSQAGYPSMSE